MKQWCLFVFASLLICLHLGEAQILGKIKIPKAVSFEPGPVIVVENEKPPPSPESLAACESLDVEDCVSKLHTFIRLNQLQFTQKKEELDDLCSKSLDGSNCSMFIYKAAYCLPDQKNEMLPLFAEMAQIMYRSLCREASSAKNYLRKALLTNSECILRNSDRLQCCSEGSNLTETPIWTVLEMNNQSLEAKRKEACCPVSSYLNCASDVIQSSCGKKAKNFFASYVQLAAGEELQFVCSQISPQFPNRDTDFCPQQIPVCSGSEPVWFYSGILLGTIFCHLILMPSFQLFR